MSSNSVCNHTRDKQIGLPLRGRLILLSLVWLQSELDSTQSYYLTYYKPVDVEIDDDNTGIFHVFEMRLGINEFDE